MLQALVIACALLWILILIHQISHRGFFVLMIWLAVAPVVSNFAMGQINPFFKPLKLEQEYSISPMSSPSKTYNAITVKEITNKPTRLLISLYIVIFIIDALLKRRHIFPLDGTETLMAIFLLILFMNVYHLSNLFGYSLRIAYDTLIIPFFGYFIARRLIINAQRLQQLIQVLGYLGGCLFLFGMAELVVRPGIFYHIEGPFDSGTGFFYALMVCFFALLSNSIASENDVHATRQPPPLLSWLIMGLIFLAIVWTWSRGVWAGFLFGLWIFMVFGHRAVHISKKIIVIGSALIFIPLMLSIAYTLIPESFLNEDIANVETIEWRFKRWNVAIEEGMKFPIFGIGLNNLRDILSEKLGGTVNNAHNSYLTLYVELGLVGFTSFVAIMVSLIRLGLRICHRGRLPRDRLRGAASVAMVVAYLIPGFFANTIFGTLDFSTLYMFVFLGGLSRLYNPPQFVVTSNRMVRTGRQGKPPMYASS